MKRLSRIDRPPIEFLLHAALLTAACLLTLFIVTSGDVLSMAVF